MRASIFLVLLLSFMNVVVFAKDYTIYHLQILEAEGLIAEREFTKALDLYEKVFEEYSFIFLRDCQVATQIALHAGRHQTALSYLRLGIEQGWEWKSIRKNKFLRNQIEGPDWKRIEGEYDSLRKKYEQRINQKLRLEVKKMIQKDQLKALGALFTFSARRQDSYAEKRFAPHSEKQLAHLHKILNEWGYPGERLIGNNYWMSTILSHHNSISEDYVSKDTMYVFLRPKLLDALKQGQISPFEIAIIDDWYRAVKSGRKATSYGYLGPELTNLTLEETNSLRSKIGLRSVHIRNKLVAIQEETGIDFYLPGQPWIDGRIKIE